MIVVAYASKHGATEGIARSIADRLRERGLPAELRHVEEADDVDTAEAVVLGSAIYAGSWLKEATEFAHRNHDALTRVPVWLFSSGPLGEQVQDDDPQPKQITELENMLRPRDHAIFFGALDRSKLGFAERMMVKAVKAPEGDFRDWDEIRAWTDGIAEQLRRESKEADPR